MLILFCDIMKEANAECVKKAISVSIMFVTGINRLLGECEL